MKQRIFDDLRQKIDSGELAPGDRLPQLSELRVQYDVSDTPVKSALDALEMIGYIDRYQGKGIFVADRTA
jgi:DNA-binding GntR family transcriptional regulator